MAELRVEQIVVRFGRQWVLRGADLSLDAGECGVLFGPNGSGKSTLLKVLATLKRPLKGRYRLDGLEIPQHAEAVRGRLLFLGHNSHIYGHLTPVENLRFFSDLRGVDVPDGALRKAVDAAGLKPFADRPVQGFSAGMRKRLALARMLVVNPPLLLLDEPYSALDTQGVDWLNALLRDYLVGGGTLVMASHDPRRVAALDHIPHHLEKGVLTRGTPQRATSRSDALPASPPPAKPEPGHMEVLSC